MITMSKEKRFCVRPEGLGWRNIECFDRARDALREATSLARSVAHKDQDTIIVVDTETNRTLAACATKPFWLPRRGEKRPVHCHKYESKVRERAHLRNLGSYRVPGRAFGLFGSSQEIVIEREKITPTPGRNYKVAYKYIYNVRRPDGSAVVLGTGLLSSARSRAKAEAKKLGLPTSSIIEAWKK